jgi:hypothetical protein
MFSVLLYCFHHDCYVIETVLKKWSIIYIDDRPATVGSIFGYFPMRSPRDLYPVSRPAARVTTDKGPCQYNGPDWPRVYVL